MIEYRLESIEYRAESIDINIDFGLSPSGLIPFGLPPSGLIPFGLISSLYSIIYTLHIEQVP